MEGEDGEEWRKLPCEDRIAHKVGVPLLDILPLLRKRSISKVAFQVWKARVNGYEEATKLFRMWDEDDNKWKSYQPLAKKMVSDDNAVALEKGLECCLAFAENCKTAPKTGGEVSLRQKHCIFNSCQGY